MNHEAFSEQLQEWHELDEYWKIVKAIKSLPVEECRPEYIGRLASAYNNLGYFKEALEQLEHIREQYPNDALWHFRQAYALFYLDRTEEARAEFVRAAELDPDDEDAPQFIERCDDILQDKAHVNASYYACAVQNKKQHLPLTKQSENRWKQPWRNFKERVDAFWDWFLTNEPQLSDIVQNRKKYDPNHITSFIYSGTKIISPSLHFYVGGNYEFTFSVDGRSEIFYLTPWLIKKMPECLKEKWTFHPSMPAAGAENYGLQLFGVRVHANDVKVRAHYGKASNCFTLRFYAEALNGLSESECHQILDLLVEHSLGEGFAHIYIADMEQAKAPEEDMIPLTGLLEALQNILATTGQKVATDPVCFYHSYTAQPQDDGEPRQDITTGTTCYPELSSGGYGVPATLSSYGVQAVFIYFSREGMQDTEAQTLCRTLADRLITLLYTNIGQPIGIAFGTQYGYVDLLLYDPFAFQQTFTELKKEWPQELNMLPFKK